MAVGPGVCGPAVRVVCGKAWEPLAAALVRSPAFGARCPPPPRRFPGCRVVSVWVAGALAATGISLPLTIPSVLGQITRLVLRHDLRG